MCGIVGKLSLDGTPVNNDILQQFDKQRSRGTQGFGLYDGEYMHMVRSASEDKILKWLCKYDSNFILFHHRFPTSTINVAQAAHPMSTKDYFGKKQYVMVHNGVIRNANDLFVGHQELGIQYRTLLKDLTFNDSESLLWDLALTREGMQKSMKAYGNLAFVMLEIEDHKILKMHFGRNSRPLKLYRDKNSFELSSEGRGEDIDQNTWYTYNYRLNRLTSKKFTFPEWQYQIDGVKSWNYRDDHTSGSQTTYGHAWNNDDDDWTNGEYESYNEYVAEKALKNTATFRNEVGAIEIGEVLKNQDWHKNDKGIYIQTAQFLDYYDLTPEELEAFRPETKTVRSRAMYYLDKGKGVYETAYWIAEDDYDQILGDADSADSIAEVLLLEGVMEYLESDPDYLTKESVSPEWSSLCNQQNLALAA